MEAHLRACPDCQQELESMRPIVDSFVSGRPNNLRPPDALWGRLRAVSRRDGHGPDVADNTAMFGTAWAEVAPGISCKLLATDVQRTGSACWYGSAGIAYPPHRHAGSKSLHLLYGELWKTAGEIHPGDYNRAEPGTADQLVWSEGRLHVRSHYLSSDSLR